MMSGDDEQPQGTKYAFDVSGEVESDPAWWKARGKTAEKAANELRELALSVTPLFSRNYFGSCIEGETTHELFRGIIDTWVVDLREQAESAQNLANACFAAAKTLQEADQNAAVAIESI